MKRKSIAIVTSLLTLACSKPERVRLTDGNNAISPATAQNVPSNTIRPSREVVLDAQGYDLHAPEGAPPEARIANSVSFSSSGGIYLAAWPKGSSEATLSPATAKPMGTSPPFSGFRAGEEWVVMVGYAAPSKEKAGTLTSFPFWVGKIDVKAP